MFCVYGFCLDYTANNESSVHVEVRKNNSNKQHTSS